MKIKATIAALAIAAGGVLALSGSASAAIDNTPVAGNVNVLPQARRIVPFPGITLATNETRSIKVAGETFEGDAHIPANATGVVVSITELNSTADGSLRVWTTGAAQPSTGAVEFKKGERKTNLAFIALLQDSSANAGKLNVQATGGNVTFVLAVMSYYTPVPSNDRVVSTIAGSEKALQHVGPSVRNDNATPGSGVTDMGSVTLGAGTYDTRIIGGFSGLTKDSVLPAGSFLEGGLFVTKGAGISSGFATVITQTQGVEIPRQNSGSSTYTIDPTIQLSTFITLTETTEVHVSLYAYSSNGGDYGSADGTPLGVKGNIRSAQFVKV